jgi:hypothetical protein
MKGAYHARTVSVCSRLIASAPGVRVQTDTSMWVKGLSETHYDTLCLLAACTGVATRAELSRTGGRGGKGGKCDATTMEPHCAQMKPIRGGGQLAPRITILSKVRQASPILARIPAVGLKPRDLLRFAVGER